MHEGARGRRGITVDAPLVALGGPLVLRAQVLADRARSVACGAGARRWEVAVGRGDGRRAALDTDSLQWNMPPSWHLLVPGEPAADELDVAALAREPCQTSA